MTDPKTEPRKVCTVCSEELQDTLDRCFLAKGLCKRCYHRVYYDRSRGLDPSGVRLCRRCGKVWCPDDRRKKLCPDCRAEGTGREVRLRREREDAGRLTPAQEAVDRKAMRRLHNTVMRRFNDRLDQVIELHETGLFQSGISNL